MVMQLHIFRTADGAGFPLPSYTSRHHVGLMLQAAIPNVIKLEPSERIFIPVGFTFGIPDGYCGMVVSLPQVAKERGLVVMGAPQIINPADREPLFILIQNESQKQQILRRGEVIAQLLIVPVHQVCWNEIKGLKTDETTSETVILIDEEAHKQPIEAEKASGRRVVKSVRERVKGKK